MAPDPQNLDHIFKYHPPVEFDVQSYERIRDAGKAFAEVIVAETPYSADQTTAIRKVEEAVMWANAARARRGMR